MSFFAEVILFEIIFKTFFFMSSRFMSAPKPLRLTQIRDAPKQIRGQCQFQKIDRTPPVTETQVLDVSMQDPSTHSDVPPPDGERSSAPSDLPREDVLEPPPGNWTAVDDLSATDIYSNVPTNLPKARDVNQSSDPSQGQPESKRSP